MHGLSLGLNVGGGQPAVASPPPPDPTPQAPIADFTISPLSGLAPLSVTLTDTSQLFGQTLTFGLWGWSHDGLLWTSTAAVNPTIQLAAGTWTFNRQISTIAGSDAKTREDYITVTG